MFEYLKPLTQKAQGIIAIMDGYHALGLKGPGLPLMVIPGGSWDCRTKSIHWPMFARPCPFRPRHGFEESICVHSWEDVINILQRAKAADPSNPVEIVLAPLLTGKASAVATNAGVTWGRGNDGVTAGTDPHTFFIPVKTSKSAWRHVVSIIVYDLDGFEVPEFPYLEIVENEGDMCLVQVRDGPEQPEGANHVVRKMKVQRVLKADTDIDLLHWESLVHIAASQKGVIIWAPDMSLASHFCVHGIESGIPVITDYKVKVDDVILPTRNRTSILRKHEYTKIAALLVETLGNDMKLPTTTTQKHAIVTSIATTQAQFCWGKEAHLLRLRGLSVAILLKAVLASCAGEIRHWSGHGGPQCDNPALYRVLPVVKDLRHKRETIYRNVFSKGFTLSKMKHALSVGKVDLEDEGWGRSFGGPRWGEVAQTGIKLAQAAMHFCDAPNAITWSKVVQKANRLINTSHNNGKCLTKWVEGDGMLMISKSPTVGFLNPYVAQVALNITDEGKTS